MIESRREFLKKGAACFFGGLLFQSPTPGNDVYDKKISRIRSFFIHKGKDDPIYRASAVTVFEDFKNFYMQAQGSIVEVDNLRYFYTASHVAESFSSEEINIHIPAVGQMTLGVDSILFGEKTYDEDDPCALYVLEKYSQERLGRLATRGVITPLELLAGIKPSIEVAVANPVISGYTNYRIIREFPETGEWVLGNEGEDLMCEGQSGSPVLRVHNGRITNHIYGVITSINKTKLIPDPLERGENFHCSYQILMRENIKKL